MDVGDFRLEISAIQLHFKVSNFTLGYSGTNMFSMLSIKATSIAPVTMWQTSTGHPNMDHSLPSVKMMMLYHDIIVIVGLHMDGSS